MSSSTAASNAVVSVVGFYAEALARETARAGEAARYAEGVQGLLEQTRAQLKAAEKALLDVAAVLDSHVGVVAEGSPEVPVDLQKEWGDLVDRIHAVLKWHETAKEKTGGQGG